MAIVRTSAMSFRSSPASTKDFDRAVESAASRWDIRLQRIVTWLARVFAVGLIAGGIVVLAPLPADSLTWVIGLGACGLGAMFLAAARGTWATSDARVNAGVLLAGGRCAQCAYTVSGLTPQHDGCIVCPECGAAWKAESIGKASRPVGA